MRTTALKLLAAIVSIPLLLVMTGITQNGIFVFGAVIALLLGILWAVDLGRHLRAAPDKGRLQHAAVAALAIPQALLGLTSLVIGVAIIGWILYNLLVAMQPQFAFNLVALPVPIALVVFGARWLKGAFRRA